MRSWWCAFEACSDSVGFWVQVRGWMDGWMSGNHDELGRSTHRETDGRRAERGCPGEVSGGRGASGQSGAR